MAEPERQVLRGLGDVVVASPLFVTAPLLRRRHLRWGATDAEVGGQMPGDEIVPRTSFNATRAITIATLRPQDQSAVLRFALVELAARGVAQTTVAVPGPNMAAQRLLWEAGFTFHGATGLLCASRPFGRFDRYLLAGDCLL